MKLLASFENVSHRRVWGVGLHYRPGSYFDQTEQITPATHFLQLVLAGRQVVSIRNRMVEAREGDITIFPRGVPTTYVHTSSMLRTLSIFFEALPGDELRSVEHTKGLGPTDACHVRFLLKLTGAEAGSLHESFHKMHQLVLHRDFAKEESSRRLLEWRSTALLQQITYGLASPLCSQMPLLSQPVAIHRVLNRLSQYPEMDHHTDELAALVGLPVTTLNRQFRQATGQSIKQYLLRVRAAQVRQYLNDYPAMGLAEIASKLGYYDEFHLSKCFKKIYGLPPLAFRRGLVGARSEGSANGRGA